LGCSSVAVGLLGGTPGRARPSPREGAFLLLRSEALLCAVRELCVRPAECAPTRRHCRSDQWRSDGDRARPSVA